MRLNKKVNWSIIMFLMALSCLMGCAWNMRG